MTNYLKLFILTISLIKQSSAEQTASDPVETETKIKVDFVAKHPRPKLQVDLLKEGFHKSLDYQLQAQHEGCYFLVEQQLPSSIYVDTDELYELTIRRGYNITFPKFIDIEKPTERASEITLLIHFEKDQNTISIPIHFRYHNPSDQQFVEVKIPQAELYKNCPIEIAPVKSKCFRDAYSLENECGWEYVENTVLEQNIAPVKIPCGDKSLGTFVTFVTLCASWIGCAVIVLGIAKKTQEMSKKLK